MKTVHAIYEKGVFRPLENVDLPNQTEVEFELRPVRPGTNSGHLDQTYAILSKSFDTDNTELAQRHDEHQP